MSRTSASRSTSRPTTSARPEARGAQGLPSEAMSTDTDGRGEDGVRAAGSVADRVPRSASSSPTREGRRCSTRIGEGRAGEATHRTSGVLVADWQGTSNAYGLFNLRERAELFIGAGEDDVYEGMVIGENSRPGDMDVNATKEKKLTNIRTHAHDEALPPRPLPRVGDRGHRGRRTGRGDRRRRSGSGSECSRSTTAAASAARSSTCASRGPRRGTMRGRRSRASAHRARRGVPPQAGAVSGSRSAGP